MHCFGRRKRYKNLFENLGFHLDLVNRIRGITTLYLSVFFALSSDLQCKPIIRFVHELLLLLLLLVLLLLLRRSFIWKSEILNSFSLSRSFQVSKARPDCVSLALTKKFPVFVSSICYYVHLLDVLKWTTTTTAATRVLKSKFINMSFPIRLHIFVHHGTVQWYIF